MPISPHQPPHPVPPGGHALAAQMPHHLPAAVERVLQVQLVQPAHQRRVLRALALRRVVLRRPAHAEQFALAGQRQPAAEVDHADALGSAQRANPRRKKSRSTVSSPIFACRSRIVASCSPPRFDPGAENTSARPSTACRFHALTWLGCTS